jgi:drug/metabolite transporter (DMT)-like permease
MALAAVMGLVMTYVALLCSTVNSPLATSITGNAKDIAATVIAAVIFRDFTPTPTNVGGILLSFCGAALFSYAKLVESGAIGGGKKAAPEVVGATGAKAGALSAADGADGAAAPDADADGAGDVGDESSKLLGGSGGGAVSSPGVGTPVALLPSTPDVARHRGAVVSSAVAASGGGSSGGHLSSNSDALALGAAAAALAAAGDGSGARSSPHARPGHHNQRLAV